MSANRSTKFLDRRDFLLLGLLSALKIGLGLLLLQRGFVAISGDEFLRSLISEYWTEKPFFSLQNAGPAAAMWMPMPFWVTGSILKITGKMWETSIGVSLFFAVVSLVALYCLGKLLAGRWVGVMACLLVLFMPWEAWLSVTALPSTIYHAFLLAAVLAFVAWEKGGRTRPPLLGWASVGFLCTTMLRPEGWLFSVVFSLYLGLAALPSLWSRKALLGWAALPWVFPLYWLWCNAMNHGHPFWFILESRRAFQMEAADIDSPLLRLAQTPLTLFVLSPIVVLLASFFVASRWRLFWKTPALKAWLVLALGGLAMLMLAGAGGLGTNTAPQRFVIPLLLMAAIPAAMFLQDRRERGGVRSILVIAVLILVLLVDFPRLWQISTTYQADFRAGRMVQSLLSNGQIAAGQLVCTERELFDWRGIPPENQADMINRFCTDWAIRVGSNQADRFTTNLDDQFQRNAEATSRKISRALQENRVALVLIQSKKGRLQLPEGFQFVGTRGKWCFYQKQPAKMSFALEQKDAAFSWTAFGEKFRAGPELAAFGVEKTAFPRFFALHWQTAGAPLENQRVFAEYLREGQSAAQFSEVVSPFFDDYPMSAWPAGRSVLQYIRLPSEKVLPPGKYWIRISLLNDAEIKTGHIISPPIWIVASKRSAIKTLIRGPERNPELIWRALTSL